MQVKQSIKRGKMWVALLGAVAVCGVYLVKSPHVAYIPEPSVTSLNAITTIQWNPVKRTLPPDGDDGGLHPGLILAKKYCVGCHLLPNPRQVPRETWPFVLTWMSNYLGYTNTYPPFANNVERSLIPSAPVVSEEEFQSIAAYYLLYATSTETHPPEVGESRESVKRFFSDVPKLGIPPSELITLVHFDDRTRRYYIGRADHKVLQVYDANGRILLSKTAESEPVGIEVREGGFRLSEIGSFIEDTNGGRVSDIVLNAEGEIEVNPIVEGFHRLTESQTVDLDNDGVEDLLLIGFGAGVDGNVAIRWHSSDGTPDGEDALLEYSGALNAVVHDFDHDGLDDIMVLTSQSRQELLLFINKGGRHFEQRLIDKRFAGFGYNHLSMSDFNSDGLMDLVVVNGNNMEIKDAPVKDYHGVRILENNGDLTFSEKYFYGMYGALKAVISDFDRDGDMDIAAIAFYPDWSAQNPETFVYLENRGGYRFKAFGLMAEDWGRWIAMTTGDINGDGFQDILMGGGYTRYGVDSRILKSYEKSIKDRPSVVVLMNRGRY